MMEKLPFISLEVFKNGSRKIHFKKPELYKVLYELGFRFARIDRRPFMYKLDERERIKLVHHFQELRDAFCDYMKKLDIPEKEKDEILNASYAKRPIKRNLLIEHYLTDTDKPGPYLTEELIRQKKNQ